MPSPLVNTKLTGSEVDILFHDHKVIVELDGWDFHRFPVQFARDRARDAPHLAQGIATLRVTWDRVAQAPGREAARLEGILRSRTP
jgi:very-short-patch-repair endonuclease